MPKPTIYLVANGDLRESANRKCEAAQQAMEKSLAVAVEACGGAIKRAHGFRKSVGHSFIDSQKYGMEVFAGIPGDAPLIVAEAVWQYSHHVLHGLIGRSGPILTVANWSGEWPGLVGMLNLNGSLTKAGVAYSTLWSEDFENDNAFRSQLSDWIAGKPIKHRTRHARPLAKVNINGVPADAAEVGRRVADDLLTKKAILGVLDEGCMGMFNAIIPDALLNACGVFKERLSQSALYYAMTQVGDEEARSVYDWICAKGMTFHFGPSEAEDLTEAQVLQQCKMYVAALRIADEFGCDAIGIQYQQGLKDLAPASDLVEGMLNNVKRPPVKNAAGKVIRRGGALPHFNEVDECAGLDGLVTYRLWRELGHAPENTLHDLRWGRHYAGAGVDADGNRCEIDDYVWVFEISGAVPPEHFARGWKDAHGRRQPPMYFRLGGSTLAGTSKPGHVVWSRVWVDGSKPGGGGGRLMFDTGLARAVGLPEQETADRLQSTTPQWPIMHAVLDGVTRDEMMARHKSNHIQVAYAPTRDDAKRACMAKAEAMRALGLGVTICGNVE